MIERRIELPPYAFWVREAGEGTPLVLVHGLSGSSRWWDRNLDELAAHHRVLAVDLVGFGRNRRLLGSPLPLSIGETASLLARWLGTLEEPVHLVGHSMGGQTALEVAARAPERIRSLTLVASTGIPFRLEARPHLEAILRPPVELLAFGPRLALDVLRAGPGSIALASARLLTKDSREAMAHVSAPTLLVWGDSDPVVPLRYAEEIRRRIPQAKLEILEGAGHVAMWDRARRFNEVVLAFLGSVEKSPAASLALPPPPFSWAVADHVGGISWRASGRNPQVVLLHGLGIGSRYFRRLVAALSERGIDAIAPDLPGIGTSTEVEEMDMEVLAGRMIEWARVAHAEQLVWVAHSTGCQLLDRVVRAEGLSIRWSVHVSPIWTRRRLPWLRLPLLLALDALHEPRKLIGEAIRAYWDAGLLRIVRHASAVAKEIGREPVTSAAVAVIGSRDPLVDRERLAEVGMPIVEIEGGHGLVWSNPEGVAEVIAGRVRGDA